MEGSGTRPSIIALVVCDNIYTESGGKTALVGLFNDIHVPEFPYVHSRLAIFVSVTGIRQGTKALLDIIHGTTDNPVIEARAEFKKDINPTTVVDMNFILSNVKFPEPGKYFIRFFGNGYPLVMRPFQVKHIKKGPSS